MPGPSLNDLLRERQTAPRAAHQAETVAVDEPSLQLVIFTLGTQSFALPGEQIREILAAPQVHYVPGAPPALEGVISVRGDIESVVCLHSLLQLDAAPSAKGAVLLSRGQHMRSGLRVDQVIDVCDLPVSALRDAPNSLPDALRPFVHHLIHRHQAAISLLDLDRLFSAYLDHAG